MKFQSISENSNGDPEVTPSAGGDPLYVA